MPEAVPEASAWQVLNEVMGNASVSLTANAVPGRTPINIAATNVTADFLICDPLF
jgi:hypothetical protein